ncbi:MAG: hypothetical protein H7343_04815 [Undibacterium sp.]|nr:hypothetical protein [Opitutaceae bacterium]
MMLAALTFSGWQWLWPAVGFLVVAALVLAWGYRAAAGLGGLRWVCLGLKIAGLAALALCLLEPLWTTQRARPGANLFAVVADNSQGLQIKDRGETSTRGESLRALLDPLASDWQATLAGTFDLRRYLFDTRLQATADFHELTFDGRATALATTLKILKERFQGRPLAGIILLTDGNATDLRAGAWPDLAGMPPVYPVVIGRREPARDLAVQQVNVSQTAFEDAPVAIQAEVLAAGFRGETVVARLTDRAGRTVQEQTLEARKDTDTLAFRFQLKPEQKGLSFYEVSVAPRGGAEATVPEATTINNRRVLTVNRGQGPYRILYVAGRPNWEYKFLSRAVESDDQVQLVGLIRVAKREPKFDFRGRAGETSNPLFRGFGNQAAEEVQHYDQPVLVRLNTRDELELRAGFPRTPEELYGYHAVILDDLENEFFAPEQAQLLQKFVSERGGGFLMLGGMESFQEGNYARTPVGDLLPVYLDRPSEQVASGPLKLELAREGWLQAWARLRDNEADEKIRLAEMPGFHVINRVRAVKPGASVIAAVRDEHGTEIPALAVQRFGRGRSAALMVGDVWRWGMKDAAARADMDKAWRQLMRWLVADVPRRVELAVEPVAADANGAVQLQVRARTESYQPLDEATVTVEVAPVVFGAEAGAGAERKTIRLPAEAAGTEAGLYETTYVPRLTGGYRATAIVTNALGAEVGRAEAGWSTDLAAEEFRSLTPNVALLEDLAKKTGGEIVAAGDLAKFARSLPERKSPVMETALNPLWHTPVMFLIALACFVGEWGLRRWKGLP